MNNENDKITELAKQATLGDSESLSRLCELSQGRLYAYIYRIALCSDTSNDIKQETMLEMCKSITNLKDAEKFWPWIRSIAYHKICNYYRKQNRHKTVSLSAINGSEWISDEIHKFKSGFGNSMSIKLEKLIFTAVSQLRPNYRAVITMRCFEDAEYNEVAETMGLSILSTRILFSRAKKALRKHLIKKGFKKEFLLPAILIFGQMTAESEAAAAALTVSAASFSIGTPAAILSLIASKASLIILAAVAAITTMATKIDLPDNFIPQTNQRLTNASRKALSSFQSSTASIKPPENQQWFYYPQNSKGPTLRRIIESQTACGYLNEGNANYYPTAKNITYIKNANLYNTDFSVLTLPFDPPAMKEFLSASQGKEDNNIYLSNQLISSLVIITSDTLTNGIKVIQNKNMLEEEFYKYNMPAQKVIDQRDQAHKRGWTYFEVTGTLNSKKITGKGRLPLVYNQLSENSPCLQLHFASAGEFADNQFSFLARPWMGTHAIDIIRRDAAERKMKFDTKILPTINKAEIIVFANHAKLIYTINLTDDIIEKIDFTIKVPNSTESKGHLDFHYIQDIGELKDFDAEFFSIANKSDAKTSSWFDWLAGNL